jgi:two-component system alkaline phosphatase synthesis response regulator PhoP
MSDTKTILVVEDDTTLYQTLELALSREGYHVLLARDGDEAISIVNKEKPDIMLLDIIMPKKNGFDVLETIRNEMKLDIPIVVLSNLSQESDIELCKELGATEYLVKSNMTTEDIVEKVRKHVG